MRLFPLTAALLVAFAGEAAAQAGPLHPPAQAGRYQMQPVEGGVARLDTETGELTLCRIEGSAMSCAAPTSAEALPPAASSPDALDALEQRVGRLEEAMRVVGKRQDRLPGRAADDPQNLDEALGQMKLDEALGQMKLDEALGQMKLDEALGQMKHVFRAFRDVMREMEDEEKGGRMPKNEPAPHPDDEDPAGPIPDRT
ncbi:hypothetical protein [Consotaella salsifontis]|uniref:LTXXQ motif family protein n=1 Tax=Consotaella salsifontis TaxID=1365950 RepID=A0A1T4MNB2_9HYPH|nr:hypothetical protein [Consotaella salsifontis]SJZ68274.1 hypothetical protein SAMN05428963_102192 [Consotaella salsifontis]